jgi:hypothetical protein
MAVIDSLLRGRVVVDLHEAEAPCLACETVAHGTGFEELIIPDEAHDFLMQQSWLKAYHAAEDVFARG